MSDAALAEPRGRRAGVLAAVLFSIAVAGVYVTPHILDADEAVFAAIGMRMRALDLPVFAGGWDHKPPGIFWIYELLTSAWSQHGLLFLHLATAAAWVTTGVVAGRAARHLSGPAAEAPTIVAYTLLRSFGETKAGAANTEAFLSPLLALGLLLTLRASASPRRDALVGGALLAAAALLKPPIALYGPAIVAAVGFLRGPRDALRTALHAAAGAAVVLGAAAFHLDRAGVLHDGLRLNVEANRIYMEHGPRQTAADLFAGIVAEPLRAPAPWIFALVAAFCALRRPEGRRAAVAMLALFAAGIAAVSLGGLLFRHYWIMLHPVLAAAAGAGVAVLVPTFPPRGRRAWLGVAAALAIALAGWLPSQWVDKRRLLRSHLFDDAAPLPYESADFRTTAAAMARLAAPGETVFVWGANPELYLLAERVPASRHVSCGLLSGWHRPDVRAGLAPPDPDVFPGAWDTLFDDLAAHPPAVVVDTAPQGYRDWQRFPVALFPRLAVWLAEHYEPSAPAGRCAIWVRRRR